jgi:hypothetical protein
MGIIKLFLSLQQLLRRYGYLSLRLVKLSRLYIKHFSNNKIYTAIVVRTVVPRHSYAKIDLHISYFYICKNIIFLNLMKNFCLTYKR